MSSEYDTFFASQPKVSFAGCIPGHIVELEGPQKANVYEGNGTWKADGKEWRPPNIFLILLPLCISFFREVI
jgi:hypothetical protein